MENAGSHLPNEVVPLVQNWSLAGEGMPLVENSTLLRIEKKHLKAMSEAIVSLQLQKQPKYMDSLLKSIIYVAQSDDALRCVVERLGQPLVGSGKLLLQQLVRLLASRKMPYTLLMPYLRLALEYALTLRALEKEQFLDPLLTELLKNVDKETFNTIDSVVNTWPPELREEWDKHSIDLKPTTFMEKVGSSIMRFLPSRPQSAQPPNKQVVAVQPHPPVAPSSAQKSPAPQLQTVQHKLPARSLPSTVAAIVSGQSGPVQISREWHKKVCQVKDHYYLYKINFLQQRIGKGGSDAQKIREMDKWRAKLEMHAHHKAVEVLKELVDDVLIRVWLEQEEVVSKKSIQQEAQEKLSKHFSFFKSCDKEKYRFLRQAMKEEEIKEALLIFIRRNLVEESLSKKQVPMEFSALLKDLRDKQSIQYNEELIFHETETPDFG